MEMLPFPDERYQLVCLTSEAELPPLAFDLFLYLQPQHVRFQNGPFWRMYALLQENRTVALAHVFVENEKAFSPWRAPFGGLQFSPDLPGDVAKVLVYHLHQNLREQGVTQVEWLQCPDVYSSKENMLVRQTLLEIGYKTIYEQRNHHLQVSRAAFTELLHPSAKRRLQKCLRAGFTVQQEGIEQLPEAYQLLQACRSEKQKPLSLSFEQLNQYFQQFPEQYQLFTVRCNGELAAVGVTVQINKRILNHLYPASPTSFNTYSPTILLTQGIYEYCRRKDIELLDLGVSAPPLESEADYQGLFTFKERLGGIVTWKPTFLFME
ncbi:GNAT family N-acetyltransferase [Rufibacter roseus]|uniref:GNAT family N-acetyltransferase n=1 Tax=Rufibacter roseus TaxID=1567108 RepID=A0ABW2DIA3_9BACT|nr:GNAT family N-acetyltransferase [Rufibacter roseus]